jgi:beta-glucosidase
MAESVREGRVPKELLDRAVKRVLRQKFQLGLFEHPFVDPDYAEKGLDRAKHRQLALSGAREGIVLLKNADNLLPLKKDIESIAVIGPNADHTRNLLGDYTSITVIEKVVTVLAGIKSKVGPGTKITYVKGCDIIGTKVNEIEAARKAAQQSKIAILVLGESTRKMAEPATDGEGADAATLELTGFQEELVEAVYATGTPTVVVLVNGRPLATRWVAEHVPAIVEAWRPGEEGGTAVADILFGDYNPNGRLPITVPRHAGQLPVYYNYAASKAYWMKRFGYVDIKPQPLYDFGYGLSYTKFEYKDLSISPARFGPAANVKISLDVRNIGEREGAETVQLYLNDVVSSVTTPARQLKRFEKVWLKPGEQRQVAFTLAPEDLMLLDKDLHWVVEPGRFDVMIGASSADTRLKGSFEVAR